MELRTDKERNRAGNEANLAFGAACLAVNDVTQAAAGRPDLPEEARSLLDEIACWPPASTTCSAAGAFAAVCELALSIVVLADRISMMIE